MRKLSAALTAALLMLAVGCSRTGGTAPLTEVRIGYFPNLTHAQAVIGVAEGRFAKAAGVAVSPKVFDAGPAAITALLAGELDLLYVGPSPAVNGYMRSEGKALKVLAGAASGGAVLVLKPGGDPAHLDGKHLATPGLGNTQDVALRTYLKQHGLKAGNSASPKAGEVRVTPMAPADALNLFRQGQLDGAWVAEPWGARLEAEGGGKIVLDERQLWPDRKLPTTVLVVSATFLQKHADVVRKLLAEHVALTQWIQANPDEARRRLGEDLAKLQGKALPDDVIANAFSRVDFTTDPMVDAVKVQAQNAYELGLLGDKTPDLSGLFDLSLYKEVSR